MSTSLLGWINRFVPKDAASERIARGIAFGPHQRHRLDLYRPRKPSAALPVMFFVYGGGWDSGDRSDYEFAGRLFAARGFLTIIADYRLVPDIRYPVFLQDNAAALNWVVAHAADYGGDPSALYLSGHSAGAYNAVMLGLAGPRYGFEAVGRIQGVAGISGPYDFYPFDVEASINAFGEARDPQGTQPVNNLSAGAPPMFLAHGSADPLVYPRNAVALARGLRRLGVDVEERHYRGLNHPGTLLALMRPLRGFTPLYRDLTGWLDRLQTPSR